MVYRYSKYIMKNLAGSAALVVLILTSIIWLTQALRFIDFIVNRGVSITTFLYLTSLLLPTVLLLIMPLALFAATLFFYHKLKQDSELVVLCNAGLSRWQLARPAVVVALAVVAAGYILSLYLLPLSNRQFKDMEVFLRDNYASLLLQEEVFNSPVDGLTVFVRERDDKGRLHGILVHDARLRDRPSTMMAEEGKLVQTAQGPRFDLQYGNRQEMRNGRLSVLYFDSYTLDISFYTEDAKQRSREVDERYLPELFNPEDNISQRERGKMWAEGHQRLSWPLYALVLVFLALAALLPGDFNRRGQWRRILAVTAMGFGVSLSGLGIGSLVAEHTALWPLMYINIVLWGAVSLHVMLNESSRRLPLPERG